jgi:hypothetical protein
MVHVTMSSAAENSEPLCKQKQKSKHATSSFTTSNVILSALPPPIDMSMKTWGFLTLGMVAPPT